MLPGFRNRQHQCFVSYSHADQGIVTALVDWLRKSGVSPWFDEKHLAVGQKVVLRLPEVMAQCRGLLLFASEHSLASNWVRQEITEALLQHQEHPGFAITIVRIDSVDVGQAMAALRPFKWLDLPPAFGEVTVSQIVGVLHAIYGRQLEPVPPGAIDVYVSRADKVGQQTERANEVCRELLGYHGVNWVGDAVDQPDFSEARIASIMEHCSGHVMILPARSKASDYRYFEVERRRSAALGLPCFICAEPGSPLPEVLRECEHFVELGASPKPLNLPATEILEAFLDDVRAHKPRVSSSIFFAHEYHTHSLRNEAARNLLTSVTGHSCVVGSEFQGVVGPQQRIVDGIANSAWVIADVASRTNDQGILQVNLNACIEVGIALGAGLGRASKEEGGSRSDRPVYVLALDPLSAGDSVEGRTRQLPWMLRSGLTVDWYRDDLDFLAAIHRIAFRNRRRLMNLELRESSSNR